MHLTATKCTDYAITATIHWMENSCGQRCECVCVFCFCIVDNTWRLSFEMVEQKNKFDGKIVRCHQHFFCFIMITVILLLLLLIESYGMVDLLEICIKRQMNRTKNDAGIWNQRHHGLMCFDFTSGLVFIKYYFSSACLTHDVIILRFLIKHLH